MSRSASRWWHELAPETRTELLRKLVHVGSGGFAATLRWLSWPVVAGLAAATVAVNAFVLPRLGGRRLHRGSDHERGFAIGILLYPASVAALALLFRERLEIVAAGWAFMAFGDGCASVSGMLWGRHRLPWNEAKSWEGTAAFWIFGTCAAFGAFVFVASGASRQAASAGSSFALVAIACAVAGFASALIESLPSGFDDNVSVPLVGAALTWLCVTVLADAVASGGGGAWTEAIARVPAALAASGAMAALAVGLRSLDILGAIAGTIMGALVTAAGGWGAFGVMTAFFVLATGATKLGRRVKEARGIAQERGGRRGLANVLANGGVAACCAPLLLVADTRLAALGAVALVAAMATAAFDTVSSEVGKAHGRTTVLVTTLRRVPPGTEGAVSMEGTVAGAAAAAAVGLVAWLGGVRGFWAPLAVPAVIAGAFVGTTFESVVGALSQRWRVDLDTHQLNAANTAVGALGAVAVFALLDY